MVTQAPLDNTVLDFWKMAKNIESRTIVLLCDLTESGKVICIHKNISRIMVF